MPHTEKSFPKQINSVQALRALAAVLVLFLHTAGMQRQIIGPTYEEPFSGFWNRGFSGVDMFFVISGFIMVYVTRESPYYRSSGPGSGRSLSQNLREALSFIKARILRIYPLWWFYAALMGLIYFLIFSIPARPEYAEAAGGTLPYLVKSFLLLPQHQLPIIDVGWTLTYEMYYYVIFAAILLLPRRLMPLALCVWVLQIFTIQFSPVYGVFFNILKSPLSLEFIGGAFMALLVLRGVIFKPKFVLFVGIAAFIAALMVPGFEQHLWQGWGRAILFGLPSLAIIYGIVTLEITQGIRSPKWSIWLGNWSYSLYLGHIIVLIVMKNIWEVLEEIGMPKALHLGSPGITDNIAFFVTSVFAAIFAAMLSYFLVERPMVRVFRRP